MERLHNLDHPARKSRPPTSQQTIIVNSDEEALATLHCKEHKYYLSDSTCLMAHKITKINEYVCVFVRVTALQVLGQEHIIVAQEQALSDQVPAFTPCWTYVICSFCIQNEGNCNKMH